VANYIGQQFGARRKHQFKQEIRETTNLLKRSPGIGQIDPLFSDRLTGGQTPCEVWLTRPPVSFFPFFLDV